MQIDIAPRDHEDDLRLSDYAPNQYPSYLLPDGSWRYGVNAKKLADYAWANRRRGFAVLKEDRNACGCDADGNHVAQ